jgi:hypothetical protein
VNNLLKRLVAGCRERPTRKKLLFKLKQRDAYIDAIMGERETLIEALTQVYVDINDPHPRNGSLKGFRKSMDATEKMVVDTLTQIGRKI